MIFYYRRSRCLTHLTPAVVIGGPSCKLIFLELTWFGFSLGIAL